MLTAPTERSPLLLQYLSRDSPSISAKRVQYASSSLSNIFISNKPSKNPECPDTALHRVLMAFDSAPCYKHGVQRWQVQRHQSKLTEQAIINHNQKYFIKYPPLQQRHTLWRLFWQRDTTKLGITTYFHCRPCFQFRTTLLLFLSMILTEPTAPATS